MYSYVQLQVLKATQQLDSAMKQKQTSKAELLFKRVRWGTLFAGCPGTSPSHGSLHVSMWAPSHMLSSFFPVPLTAMLTVSSPTKTDFFFHLLSGTFIAVYSLTYNSLLPHTFLISFFLFCAKFSFLLMLLQLCFHSSSPLSVS